MTTGEKILTGVCSFLLVILFFVSKDLESLRKERDAYDWRNFTCRVLLDDPQTRAIMDTKWKREDKKFRCDREQMIKDRMRVK